MIGWDFPPKLKSPLRILYASISAGNRFFRSQETGFTRLAITSFFTGSEHLLSDGLSENKSKYGKLGPGSSRGLGHWFPVFRHCSPNVGRIRYPRGLKPGQFLPARGHVRVLYEATFFLKLLIQAAISSVE